MELQNFAPVYTGPLLPSRHLFHWFLTGFRVKQEVSDMLLFQ